MKSAMDGYWYTKEAKVEVKRKAYNSYNKLTELRKSDTIH